MVKIVKIYRDRGYGDGMFEVIKEIGDEVLLQELYRSEIISTRLYKLHTYEDMDTRRKGFALQRERAAKIGRK